MYAYTRIKSIGRTIGNTKLAETIEEFKNIGNISLDHEKELKLAKLLLRFSDIISKISDDLFLHTLSEFMYEVATVFTEFYDACYCVEKDRTTKDIIKIFSALRAESKQRISKTISPRFARKGQKR